MRKAFLAAALVLAGPLTAALVGCGGPKTPEQRKNALAERLPSNAKVLEDRGNNWWLIEIKGKKYLYHCYAPGANCATETIVEVKE